MKEELKKLQRENLEYDIDHIKHDVDTVKKKLKKLSYRKTVISK